ncbi:MULTISPECIES: hypothetical protein [unclassified Bosea (in: a-proteobacteria)]|uniref:DUF6894 family protein n=1 Tax=unclassified Bosea (in: a-proteobacteria) TaxID=2653178 RepID=UPI000F76185B|nr:MULTISPECIES: hypothetical protein [unclassified Bosea (in: a-proteobacteria)]AZO82007.1 hypothetical protein BLM15_29885 [Bosea sp. Tri-49]RXT16673.1 hypothetical protein B5U98_27490 [Bosea sp. Tri-39]RXT42406.1 hypothetical protein B5U99_00430 [Bosea sp. Tri-54]
MPKFTITTDGGEGPERSDEALEFADTKAVIDDAQIALVEMAREKLPNGKHADFEVKVEDETGRVIYVAEMHFKARTEENVANAAAEIDDVASHLAGGPRD